MLLLETLHFPDEVRDAKDAPIGVSDQTNVSEKEFEIGMMLIEQLTTAFDPTKYTDTYRTALEKLIQEKMEKNDYIAASDQPTDVERSNVVDLMSALQASIDKTKKAPPPKPARTKGKSKKTS